MFQLIEEYQSQEENMPDLNEADIEGEIEIVVLENIEIVESGNERERPLVELGPGAPVCPGWIKYKNYVPKNIREKT